MSKVSPVLVVILTLAFLLLAGCGQGAATPSTSTQSALKITTTALANGQTGLNYSQTLQASGGTKPYVWSVTEGSLPDGLLFSANNGIISGIPQKAGVFDISVEVKDAQGTIADQKVAITVKAATLPLTSSTGGLNNGEVSVTYSQPLKVYGGDGKYSWSIANGTLPEGLTLSSSGGIISGIPTTVGKNYFTVKVVDGAGTVATEALTITVNGTLSIDASGVGAGEIGIVYSQTAEAIAGVPNYVWTVIQGSLPAGLKIDAANGNISGSPTVSGVFKFTLQLIDSANGKATQDVSLQIFEHVNLPSAALPSGIIGTAYSQMLNYSGGNGTVIWAQAGGTLPDGLSFDGNTGVISGTPKSAGKFNFSIQVIDSLGADSTQSFDLEIK